jgi:hypothetical protein
LGEIAMAILLGHLVVFFESSVSARGLMLRPVLDPFITGNSAIPGGPHEQLLELKPWRAKNVNLVDDCGGQGGFRVG